MRMIDFIKPTAKTKPILQMIYKQILYAPDTKTIWLSKSKWDSVMSNFSADQKMLWKNGITDGDYILKTRG